MPATDLNDHVVLITGAARRLGAHLARRLHQRGAHVALHCQHSVAEAHELAAELQAVRTGSVSVITADLRDTRSATAVVSAARSAFGRLDVLINNASVFEPGGLASADGELTEQLLAVNLRAPFLLAGAAAKPLRETTGCIINMLDIYASRPRRGYSSYSITKAGLLGATRALALELAPEVRVNGIAPGPILWPDGEEEDTAAQAAILDSTVLKRMGEPDDIAAAALFLIREARYLTGEVLTVDGGRSLLPY